MTATGRHRKKYYTVAEANAMLPLVRSIVRDVMNLAHLLRDRHDRIRKLRKDKSSSPGEAYLEELEKIEEEMDKDREKMAEFEQELVDLGVELKDYFTGLVDFPHLMDGREVYLCWRFEEPDISYWHELDAGFAGRQKLLQNVGPL